MKLSPESVAAMVEEREISCKEACRLLGKKYTTITSRIYRNRKKPLKKILAEPVGKPRGVKIVNIGNEAWRKLER